MDQSLLLGIAQRMSSTPHQTSILGAYDFTGVHSLLSHSLWNSSRSISAIGIQQGLSETTRALVLQSLAGVGSCWDPSSIGFDCMMSGSNLNMASAFPEIGGNLQIPWNIDAACVAPLGHVNALALLQMPQARADWLSGDMNTVSREQLLQFTDMADRMSGSPTAAPKSDQGIENPSDVQGGASSMTPAGISHQDLYARDELDGGGDKSDNAPRLLLYMQSCDEDNLTTYQCLLRKQIEIFEATAEDIASTAQGRNKPIVPGQVGIRCRHCAGIPPRHRTRGATYYPAKLNGLYQAAQNMANAHLCSHCQLIPDALRRELTFLRDNKSCAGGGKLYWAKCVRILGVVESDCVLRFKKNGESSEAKSGEVEDEEVMSVSEGTENVESKRKYVDVSSDVSSE